MEKLTIQEEEVMIYIWELENCFVKEIVAKFEPPAPPYTTIASIVKNLERKGYVTARRVGKGVCHIKTCGKYLSIHSCYTGKRIQTKFYERSSTELL